MDYQAIGAAIASAKAISGTLQGLLKLRIDTEALTRINEAQTQLGAVQEALFEAREDLFRLQKENNELREQLKKRDDWDARLAGYRLVKTTGGAIVYESISDSPKHFVCPSCVEKRQIHIIQDIGLGSEVCCPGCKLSFSLAPEEPPRTIEVKSHL